MENSGAQALEFFGQTFLRYGQLKESYGAKIRRDRVIHFGRPSGYGGEKRASLANLAAQEHRGACNPVGVDWHGIAIIAHNAFFTAGIGLFCPQLAPVSPLVGK